MIAFPLLLSLVPAFSLQASSAGAVQFAQAPIAAGGISSIALVDPAAGQIQPGTLYLIQWPRSPNQGGDIPVASNIGAYTGFAPANPLAAQEAASAAAGAAALQAEGDQLGILIDSASLRAAAGASALYPIVAHYDFPPAAQFKPFAGAGALLVYSIEAQIPYATGSGQCGAAGSGCSYATLYFDLKDAVSGLQFWYGAEIFDSRGTPNGAGGGEVVMYDGGTRQAIIGGIVSLKGARFSTYEEASAGFQARPWTGYKLFEFAISAPNLAAAIAAVKSSYPQQYSALSSAPADYVVFHFNFNPEVAYFGSDARIGASFKNISIAVR